MVKPLWRFFGSVFGAPVACVQLGDRQPGQGIAPISGNFGRRAHDKAAFAHQRMGDGERRCVAVKHPAAPQQDIEIKDAARPWLAPPETKFRLDALEPAEQARGRQSRFNDRDGVGIGALGGADGPRGNDPRYSGNGQILNTKLIQTQIWYGKFN